MGHQSLGLSEGLRSYLLEHSVREFPALTTLREATAKHPDLAVHRARNQIAPEQGQYMAWLVQLMGATRCLEWGTFTGYSAAVVALALPEGGCVHACDVDAEITNMAQHHWQHMGVSGKIKHRVCTVEAHVQWLLAEGYAQTFDFIFIDASKKPTEQHFEWAMQLCRVGGVILVDDVLQGGRVAAPNKNDWCARAMDAFNRKRHTDPRVLLSVIPIGDGLSQMIKR